MNDQSEFYEQTIEKLAKKISRYAIAAQKLEASNLRDQLGLSDKEAKELAKYITEYLENTKSELIGKLRR